MNTTKIIGALFKSRQKALESYDSQAEAIQNAVLRKLVDRAAGTEWGLKYDYGHIRDYRDYQRVPIQTYEEIKGYVDRMRHGEKNVLWPGQVVWYAKSSGTTNDKSKFIPVSKEGLQRVHYAGGRDSVALYLKNNPDSRLFSGRALILGGSHASNYNLKHSLVGDLSAILIENINPLVNLIRVPKKEIALCVERKFSSIFGRVTVELQISRHDRFPRKKYIGEWSLGSEMTTIRVAAFPATLTM